MKKHKHHDMIVAWAKGAVIQFRFNEDCIWRDVAGDPKWLGHLQYRVKPEPKQRWVRPYFTSDLTNVYICDLPDNKFDAVFGPRNWAGPAVLVWEEK